MVSYFIDEYRGSHILNFTCFVWVGFALFLPFITENPLTFFLFLGAIGQLLFNLKVVIPYTHKKLLEVKV